MHPINTPYPNRRKPLEQWRAYLTKVGLNRTLFLQAPTSHTMWNIILCARWFANIVTKCETCSSISFECMMSSWCLFIHSHLGTYHLCAEALREHAHHNNKKNLSNFAHIYMPIHVTMYTRTPPMGDTNELFSWRRSHGPYIWLLVRRHANVNMA